MTALLARFGQRFWALVLVISLALAGISLVGHAGTPKAATVPQTLTTAATIRASGALPLGLGLHVKNLYGMNLSDQSFLADGWFWLEWGDEVEAIRQREKIEPLDLVEFVNSIESGQYLDLMPLTEGPVLSAGGMHGQAFKFSSKFYIDEVPQRRAPFDQLPLPIVFEVQPDVFSVEKRSLLLYPLSEASSLGGDFSDISGFTLDSEGIRSFVHRYPTDFGSSGAYSYSRLVATFSYGVQVSTVFFKWLLPLLIVMTIVILAPSIEGALGDVRLAIPSTALLTLVFLHDGYKGSFPPVPYLTYLDEIYAYSYLVCLGLFLLFLVGTNAHAKASAESLGAVTHRVNRLDRICQLSAVIGFLVVAVLGWFV
jgi:hypothetical protein